MVKKKITVLESLRGFASIYVALGHWLLWQKHKPFYTNFFKLGVDAVTVFFLLSGIVIFYSHTNTKDKSLRTYFFRRFRRIYFPFLVSAIVSILIFYNSGFSFKELAGNFFMLQDQHRTPGLITNTFLGNQPLWSLSYEWAFSMIFPFIYPVIRNSKIRVHIIGIFCILNFVIYTLFPNHIFLVLTYFFLWWTGLEIGEYFFGERSLVKGNLLMIYYVLFMLILGANWLQFYLQNKVLDIGAYPFLPLRQFGFAFVCLMFALHLPKISKAITTVLQPFSKIAPISYSIYILHFPLWIQLHLPFPPLIEIGVKITLLLVLSYLTEIVLQPVINKYVK